MQLPVIDIIVLAAYLAGVVVFGCCFVRKSRTTTAFMAAGLLIAATAAAAMSSIDTSLNSSATVTLSDLYRRYLRPQAGECGGGSRGG